MQTDVIFLGNESIYIFLFSWIRVNQFNSFIVAFLIN